MVRITKQAGGKTVPLKPLDKAELEKHIEMADAFTRNQLESSDFKANFGKWTLLLNLDGMPHEVWVGTESPPSDPRISIHLFAELASGLPDRHTYSVDTSDWPEGLDWDQAALGWGLASYHFDRFLEKKQESEGPVLVLPEMVDLDSVKARLDSVFLARDLINLPANALGPKE
jgi:leucyl aminopeptidase